MHPRLANSTTGILTLCAVIVTGLLVKREFFTRPPPAASRVQEAPDGWESLAAGGSVIGSPEAPVKIIFFSDFECPFCARAHTQLETILAAHPERVAVAYYHFPLVGRHPHAMTAAMASECANEQDVFREYFDALFKMQDSLGITSWGAFAEYAGVPDLPAFDRCLLEDRYRDRIDNDLDLGHRFGVRGTPTIILNGHQLTGYNADVDGEWLEKVLRDGPSSGLGRSAPSSQRP